MTTVNIHQAKTHLSRLVNKAVCGEPLVIARAGKPLVVVTSLGQAPNEPKRLGFLPELKVPDDSDAWEASEVQNLFEGVR